MLLAEQPSLEIELLDSSEKPVERTEDGKTYEKLMSADHLQERISLSSGLSNC